MDSIYDDKSNINNTYFKECSEKELNIAELIILGFDLSCTQVAINLDDMTMHTTGAFRKFCESGHIFPINNYTPLSTLIRYITKCEVFENITASYHADIKTLIMAVAARYKMSKTMAGTLITKGRFDALPDFVKSALSGHFNFHELTLPNYGEAGEFNCISFETKIDYIAEYTTGTSYEINLCAYDMKYSKSATREPELCLAIFNLASKLSTHDNSQFSMLDLATYLTSDQDIRCVGHSISGILNKVSKLRHTLWLSIMIQLKLSQHLIESCVDYALKAESINDGLLYPLYKMASDGDFDAVLEPIHMRHGSKSVFCDHFKSKSKAVTLKYDGVKVSSKPLDSLIEITRLALASTDEYQALQPYLARDYTPMKLIHHSSNTTALIFTHDNYGNYSLDKLVNKVDCSLVEKLLWASLPISKRFKTSLDMYVYNLKMKFRHRRCFRFLNKQKQRDLHLDLEKTIPF